jgi:hypothetical protein
VARTLGRKLAHAWPVLAVVVVIGLVFGLGGFNKRSDAFESSGLGQELDCRNLVFTFTGATVRHVASQYAGDHWEVVALGSVRNPNEEALSVPTGDYGQFAFKDEASKQVVVPDGSTPMLLGDDSHRAYVPPGIGAISIAVPVDFDNSYQPGSEILLAVVKMEYTDNAVLGLSGGQAEWNTDSLASTYLVHLPLTRLEDK